ncbi:MAG: hypothetical protein RLZ56_336 [Bacteroidota bacterium]|jgi:hypothetical protein
MGYRTASLLILFFLFPFLKTNAQSKIIGECAIRFSITQTATLDTIGSKWVYVKGDDCKTILNAPQLVQTLLFNVQHNNALIAKDIGTSHFLQEISYPPSNTPNLLSMKELVGDSVTKILGYTCKGVEQKWSDGVVYQIWYIPEISVTVNAFELAFKEVPGLVLSYTIVPVAGNAIHYQATYLDLSPIPLSQFNINKELYQRID